ncbi:putative 2-aminoethylphosphonate ABC transporter permease subunit [Peribacillus asahii]|uniref:Phosphonate ABC transporter permease n=1 Tax=Peribacillus asahii TaxID=228899 RepID=A0A3Q9RMM8_9BACI|nr:putative 2-aminoethylphosphonate ABC transporter permease subunit [Peribacillus asahii]AZV42660.1 phosphonate ABC transporter permease [Peribacillus asahii]USK86925.1 putative 2-aminoethylphosphonate ABC transporter permease subunit [Peribacillus asahii]
MDVIRKTNSIESRNRIHKDDWIQRSLLLSIILIFLGVLVLPLATLFTKAFQHEDGTFVGLDNFIHYFSTPSLVQSLQNTLFIASMTTVISVSLAFVYAYCLIRTNIKGKAFFHFAALLPLFAPTMMHGIALMYLFGNQGLITTGFFGAIPGFNIDLYGPIGIIMAEVIYTFPQAFLIMLVALNGSDYRLYEAANTLGVHKIKQFMTITLSSVKYGLISAIFVVFSLSFTDYGAPKVVGGQYNVLATDVYKQVIGQQKMEMGATVGIILILPALVAFLVDQMTQRKQGSYISSKSAPYQISENRKRDMLSLMFCFLVSACIMAIFAAVALAASVKVWPYDMSLTWKHFELKSYTGDGLTAYKNSLIAAALTAVFGTIFTFISAYAIEKIRKMMGLRKLGHFLSIVPLAIPGLVIGLSYVFFFSQPEINVLGFTISNPLNFLYGTIAIVVIANILHFYSVAYVTATTALKKLDREFELVSESMGVPFYKTFFKITLPMCLPAVLEMTMYFFVNAMVTVSAVIFLYTADFKLAAISIVNMDDAGNLASAAAMSVLIIATNIIVRVLYESVTKILRKKNNKWQNK